MKKKEILRKKYPKFVYEKYLYKISKNNLEIFFNFKILSSDNYSKNICFNPKIVIKNINKKRLKIIGDKALDNFIFHIGLMEIPSYWKTVCSQEIKIKAGYLNKAQIKWWQDFFLNGGMSQFFYENKINFTKTNFLKIQSKKSDQNEKKMLLAEINKNNFCLSSGYLIPMGEGKDSITTLELLKKFLPTEKLNCLVVNPTKQHFKIFKIAGIKHPIIIKRKIDPVLIKLNQRGFLNGHTPITALISNLAVFCSVLFGYKNIAMSCEKSSNQGNVLYLGKIINHQYSKSFEFEKNFRNYIKKYLTKNVNYFSFLRQFSDIQIAEMFSYFPQYFSVFLSCNEARKTYSGTKKPLEKWCGNCSKCLFIFTILYPFIKNKELIKIFKENLFEKKTLLPIMRQLISEKKTKPFECVGTKKESLIAFYLSWKSAKKQSLSNLPFLLTYFEKNILPKYSEIKLKQDAEKILRCKSKQNFVPEKFNKICF